MYLDRYMAYVRPVFKHVGGHVLFLGLDTWFPRTWKLQTLARALDDPRLLLFTQSQSLWHAATTDNTDIAAQWIQTPGCEDLLRRVTGGVPVVLWVLHHALAASATHFADWFVAQPGVAVILQDFDKTARDPLTWTTLFYRGFVTGLEWLRQREIVNMDTDTVQYLIHRSPVKVFDWAGMLTEYDSEIVQDAVDLRRMDLVSRYRAVFPLEMARHQQ